MKLLPLEPNPLSSSFYCTIYPWLIWPQGPFQAIPPFTVLNRLSVWAVKVGG